MSEETKNALDSVLADAIQKTQGGIEKAVDFSLEQAPLLIQEALTWYGVKSFLSMLLSVAILIALVVIFVKAFKWAKKHNYDEEDMFFGCLFFAMGSIIPIVIAASFFSIEWIQIWIAPRVWLIEYASKLI